MKKISRETQRKARAILALRQRRGIPPPEVGVPVIPPTRPTLPRGRRRRVITIPPRLQPLIRRRAIKKLK